MQVKENQLNNLMADLVTLESRYRPAWDVIGRVLGMKKNRFFIDGFKLVHHLPSEFLDRYQSAHSVRRVYYLLFIIDL